jgi:hypothetical protein
MNVRVNFVWHGYTDLPNAITYNFWERGEGGAVRGRVRRGLGSEGVLKGEFLESGYSSLGSVYSLVTSWRLVS